MKTTTRIIKTLFGAVPTLLVPFGLTRNAAALARLLIIGLAFLVAAPSEAAKGGGTGGGGTPEGTIYYVGPWTDATTGGTAVMTAMKPDGSGKTQLGIGMFGNPSTVLYEEHRWFIYTYVFPGQYYPDGITRRSEVFALRDDWNRDLNNNANTAVQLTDDPTLQPSVGSADWVPGGVDISFAGRRWSDAEPGATVVDGGIYRASLVFGAEGTIVGLAEQPATPAIPFPLVESTSGYPWPALVGQIYCWDPTGSFVAYEYGNALWLADLHNTHTRIHIGPARRPQWSPDGFLIAFFDTYGIATIKPNGTAYNVIIPQDKNSTTLPTDAHFSPDSSYIVYTHNGDVFRATSKGANRVNLTKTPPPLSEQTYAGAGAGWR